MKFSTKTEYGMRAMVYLAKYFNRGTISLTEIAEKEEISHAYLERLIAKLRQAKLVKSVKGVKGGYTLAKSPDKIDLFSIVKALEGPIIVFDCLVENRKIPCNRKTCLTKKIWQKVQDQIIDVLKKTKLSELI